MAGFHAIWTGERHGMAFTIAPNPFSIVDLARRTKNMRLGTGTVVAPFWHPIKLAGEAAMTDIISGGRLDIGIARGAYSFEYERLARLDARTAGQRMREMVPDAEGARGRAITPMKGSIGRFPKTTPRPAAPAVHPPIWVAARDPNSHEFAVANGCNVQVTPLATGDEEVEHLDRPLQRRLPGAHPEIPRPKIMLLMHTSFAGR